MKKIFLISVSLALMTSQCLAAWDLNDVSFLLPLPKETTSTLLFRTDTPASAGELIPQGLLKLLPTLDTLEQGLRHAPDNIDKSWLQGIEGTLQKLDKVLEEMGVKRIEAVGKKFDPNFHEAVREVEGEEDGMVMEELQTGFEINGKVIRPSQVVISKKG
jgi:molecular chaperone GrpE